MDTYTMCRLSVVYLSVDSACIVAKPTTMAAISNATIAARLSGWFRHNTCVTWRRRVLIDCQYNHAYLQWFGRNIKCKAAACSHSPRAPNYRIVS